MKNNKKKYIATIIICAAIAIFFSSGIKQQQPVEELSIVSALGLDVEKQGTYEEHIVPMSVYLFEPQEKIDSTIKTGKAASIGETRQVRQLTDDKQTILGLEKILVVGEQQAMAGFSEGIEALFRNPYLNDTAYAVVCKGKAINMLDLKIKGFPSSADYIEGLIKNSKYYNFFSNNYKVMDVFFSVDNEGRSLVLPYIEITDKGVQITGMALFNKDKMVAKINIDELREMNIMREDNVKGIISMQKSDKKSTSYYATSKRKITCTKDGDKYKFTINLSLKGDLETDTLYKDLQKNSKSDVLFKKEMSEYVEKKCEDFIIKMKNQYKVDCLQLGQVAAAKYGRHTGVDWNSIVCSSEIKVNVKVEVEKTGRGDY